MPIDRAMSEELAEAWFPPFLAATNMSPSHPLRATLFEAAEAAVIESYAEHAAAIDDGRTLIERDIEYTATASDVIEVLRGVAAWVANHADGA
jgi:hypothetical protein